ncbi:SUZ domain-containing protein 1 isoform X2 [Rissa tridactyla]|uniref:SUZ domain-containing protein 1 isoform X2 n=1 Tax=Rissa tridactyla TaxID=75485 RepID=UPI0023BB0B39|nr:SUZ domain-containing protein 1 isoform X2 [Rissa tridactyla]
MGPGLPQGAASCPFFGRRSLLALQTRPSPPPPPTPPWPCGAGRQRVVSAGRSRARNKAPAAGEHAEIDRRLEKKLKITQKERAGSSRLDVATAMGKPFKKKTLKGRNGKSKSPPKVPIVIQDDSLPAGPPPQIRILKRPTTNGVLSNPNSASRPAFPVKSLAQREAEYAEARKRILGSASPEEEQEKPILDRPPRLSQPEDTRQPNNVIRQPLGPDGSQGFKQRR